MRLTVLLLSLAPVAVLDGRTEPQPHIARLLACIAQVESSWLPGAYNKSTDACGYFQLTPIFVKDCNRIVGHKRWSLADRWDGQKSIDMIIVYWNQYGRGCSLEELAAVHYAGPRGAKLLRTSSQIQIYVNKVMRHFQGD